MGSKEVMVTAPLVVLLYDRIFIATSFMEIFRKRSGLYAGLAATWLVLLLAIAMSRPEDTGGVNPTVGAAWNYALTQFAVIVHYLRLSVWPSPLVLDYAWPLADNVSEVLPWPRLSWRCLAATIFGLARQPWLGFWGAWFFIILAPTSTVLPIADPAFEHRLYLPLAALAVMDRHRTYELLRVSLGSSGGRAIIRHGHRGRDGCGGSGGAGLCHGTA
jgi:hypothetical protein